MPVETRTLVFDAGELVTAAYEYCVASDTPIPTTRVLAVEVGPESAATCVVRFDGDANEAARTVALSYSQVASALILFCRKRRIPLPRASEKRLKPAGDGIALMLHIPAPPRALRP
jgi:hypothetical protein